VSTRARPGGSPMAKQDNRKRNGLFSIAFLHPDKISGVFNAAGPTQGRAV
jgi:hypothetical protein